MLAKILIPVTGASDNTKPSDNNGQNSGKPSFLLIPAVPALNAPAQPSNEG